MLGERLGQGGAALHVRLDGQDQFLHRRIFVADADDLEGLDQRDTGGQHGGQLAAENSDVGGVTLPADWNSVRLLANPDRAPRPGAGARRAPRPR